MASKLHVVCEEHKALLLPTTPSLLPTTPSLSTYTFGGSTSDPLLQGGARTGVEEKTSRTGERPHRDLGLERTRSGGEEHTSRADTRSTPCATASSDSPFSRSALWGGGNAGGRSQYVFERGDAHRQRMLLMMSSRLLHHRSTQSFREVLHESTARFLNHSTARAFREWVKISSNSKRMNRIAVRITRRLCHRTTVQAWDRWAEELVKSQRKRHLVAKAVRRWNGRWTSAAVSNAFQVWADALERKRAEQNTRRSEKLENDNSGMASKLHEVREENKALLLRSHHMTERGEAHRQRLLLNLSSRLLHRSTGRAFLAWVRNARNEREGRSKVGLASRRWRQRDVASAYQTWHEQVVNMKMRVMLNKAVQRWRLLGLLVPFRMWHSRVVCQKKLVSASGKVASRRQKLETSVAFGRWMEAVAKQNLLTTTVRRIICRVLYHSKARAFREWVESFSNGKRIKRVERRIARTLCHRMIARRFCRRTTAHAWDRWADEVVKSQRKRYLVEKAVGRWANAVVAKAFQMWADALERECRRRVRVPIGGPTPTTQFSFRRGRQVATEFSSHKHTPRQTPDIEFTFCKQTPSTEFFVG